MTGPERDAMDPPATNHAPLLAEPVTDRDHALGPADAPVTIVEYGDYECPDCLNFVPVIAEVRRRMGERLRFVFRHFPRNNIHPHASTAAEVAEAASEQGKFWEMHAALFRHRARRRVPARAQHLRSVFLGRGRCGGCFGRVHLFPRMRRRDAASLRRKF